MLRWLLVAIFIGGIAHAQPVSDDPGASESPQEGQAEPSPGSEPSFPIAIQDAIERIARALEAQNAKEPSADEIERAKRDLRAQEDMAKWALGVFIASVASLLLTCLGVYLIWRTLVHTRDAAVAARDAVNEAKIATEAAEETIAVTREVGEAQVRAYLAVQEATFVIERQKPSQIHLVVKNTGQSPARLTIFTGKIALVVDGKARTVAIDGSEGTPDHGIEIASDEIKLVSRFVPKLKGTARELKAWFDGNVVTVEAAITLKFFDVFGHRIDDPQHWYGVARSQSNMDGLELARVASRDFPEEEAQADQT